MLALFYHPDTGKGLYTVDAEISVIQELQRPFVEIPEDMIPTMKSPAQFEVVGGDVRESLTWLEESLQQLRQEAALPKLEFLKRARNAGYITREEALIAAKGDLPETMEEAFQGMPQDVQDVAAMEWAASSQIERLHPVLLALAAAKNIGSEQLDELFGIVP